MKKANRVLIGLFVGIVVFGLGEAAEAKEGWVPANGSVTYKGAPVCAMVLINGQYAFTCSGDGTYDMAVPPDANGKITVQAFCSGRIRFDQISRLVADGMEAHSVTAHPTLEAIMAADRWARKTTSGFIQRLT